MEKSRRHLLYFTAEPWPTFRSDVSVLFGKYMPRQDITCDLVTAKAAINSAQPDIRWGGGREILCKQPSSRAGQYIARLLHDVKTLLTSDMKSYDAIQVRDMSLTALLALIAARVSGVKYFYWMSYPQSEGQVDRARKRGIKAGMRFWFPLIQGIFGQWLLYRIVLPRADHVFVQSREMKAMIAEKGIPLEKMTPVQMGVDLELINAQNVHPSVDSRLQDRRLIVYLGTMDRVRRIDTLFDTVRSLKKEFPDVLLLLVGDTEDEVHREWLREQINLKNVVNNVLWLGWLSSADALSYVSAAEIGLSPFPRGFLLDSASPTKVIEYMALGLPVVANDNPDQAQALQESAGGLCVNLDENALSNAVSQLLKSPQMRMEMGKKGRLYVEKNRSYESISRNLGSSYRSLL